MNAPEIITWLREQAKRVPEEVHKRGMIEAAAILERLRNNLKTAVAQRNEFQEKYWAEKERSARLEAELKAEMHRHDRLQDFEVAEAAELAKVKAENAAMAAELKKAAGCGACKSGKVNWLKEPCFSCQQDPNYPGWEWKGEVKG